MKRFLIAVGVCLGFASFAHAALNINTATQAQLEKLQDIGPVKAKAIVAYRAKHGQFKSLKDLQKVPGIGHLTAEKIKAEISFADGLSHDTSDVSKKTLPPVATAPAATSKNPAAAAAKQ